jgi:hemoglobin
MAPAAAMATAPSLYQALGEKAGIRAVMDDLVQRLATDPRTTSLFTDTNRAQLASQLTDQSCQLTGGPCSYKGPDMKTAHEDMKLTQAHFNALVEMAQQAMSAQGVPFATQNRLLALLAPMHRDVVTVH